MAFITKNFTTSCSGDLLDAINADTTIGVFCLQVVDPQNGTSIFEFESVLTVSQDDALDDLLATWSCPIVPPPDSGSQVVNDALPPSTDTIWTSEKTSQEIQSAVAAKHNYIPIVDSSLIETGKQFLITAPGSYVLPDITTLSPGDSIVFAKVSAVVPSIETFGTQLIVTDIGNDSELIYDLTQDLVFVVAGLNWELQFGGTA
jgi:hypothetical protein